MKWRVILEPDPETGDWAIWCPELPGCTSAGETQEEALENITEAIQLYLQVLEQKAHEHVSDSGTHMRPLGVG